MLSGSFAVRVSPSHASLPEPEPSRSQAYDLTDAKLPCSDNCPINARVVFVHADHGLHYLGVCVGRVRVECGPLAPYTRTSGRQDSPQTTGGILDTALRSKAKCTQPACRWQGHKHLTGGIASRLSFIVHRSSGCTADEFYLGQTWPNLGNVGQR